MKKVTPHAQKQFSRLMGLVAVTAGRVGLDKVRDPRHDGGRVHSLPGVLTCLLAGLAAGCRSLAALERLTHRMSPELLERLGLTKALPDTTARDLVMRLDLSELRLVLYRQVKAARRAKQLAPVELPFNVVAIDGKYTATPKPDRVYAQGQKNGLALVRTLTSTLTSTRAAVCIDAHPIPKEMSESSAFPAAFEALLGAYGDLFRLVSTDAGFNSRANANLVVENGRDYLFAIKEDQSTLLHEAARLLERRDASEADALTVDYVNNQTTDERRVWLTDDMAGYHGWTHLRGVVRVQRIVRKDGCGVVSCEDRFFVSSLPTGELTPEQWLRVVRNHWRVENETHGVLDRFFEEDKHPWIRDGYGMLVVMLLRRVASNMLLIYRNITTAREHKRRGMVPWDELMEGLYCALVGIWPWLVGGLRWPAFLAPFSGTPPG